jgi:hypothetical protein
MNADGADESRTAVDAHSQWCANRNPKIALGVAAFCGLEAFLSWRTASQAPSNPDWFFQLVSVYVIFLLLHFLVAFKCVRERLVLGIFTATFVVGVAGGFAPSVFGPAIDPLGRAETVLWGVAFLVSLTMIYSSLRLRPKPLNQT